MTSNSWHIIAKAMARRPGRIDHVIRFDDPGERQRAVLLEKFLRDVPHEADPGALIRFTEGFSVARMKEMIKKAVVRSLAREREGHPARLLEADFETAARIVATDPLRDPARRPARLRRPGEGTLPRPPHAVEDPPGPGEDPPPEPVSS